jgi:hypothetical protein
MATAKSLADAVLRRHSLKVCDYNCTECFTLPNEAMSERGEQHDCCECCVFRLTPASYSCQVFKHCSTHDIESTLSLQALNLLRLHTVHSCSVLQHLQLSGAPDLVCSNLMCEKVGSPCLCRIAVVLQRLPVLTHLDISDNSLSAIPDAICKEYLPSLQHLNISKNRISELPAALKSLQQLQVQKHRSLS